jgi:hypothetical protein
MRLRGNFEEELPLRVRGSGVTVLTAAAFLELLAVAVAAGRPVPFFAVLPPDFLTFVPEPVPLILFALGLRSPAVPPSELGKRPLRTP